MSGVRVEEVSKVFPGKQPVHALLNVTLNISSGEFFVLTGPSGSGKTTLLRIIAGLEKATGGDVRFDGAPAVGMVFQRPALFPHLNAGENIGFGLKLARRPRGEIEKVVREIAAQLGLEDLLHRKPKELSGGEQQRVALGRTLAQGARVILFDEPLSSLDLRARAQIRGELRKLHRDRGLTCIYVTHDQAEAMALADRMGVLSSGELQQVGAPRLLYEQPANLFTARFIGSPEINVLEAIVAEGQIRLKGADWALPARSKISRTEVFAAVRPEHVFIGAAKQHEKWRIVRVEEYGWERHVHLQRNAVTIVARVAGAEHPQVGNETAISIAPEKVLLYDKESRMFIEE